jgi:hypothetical protein
MGRNSRWWTEEIYASFVGGIKPREKQTTPQESTMFLWLSLMEGAAGALYWQYRPEYMTFEAPGLSLVSLDGTPTPRWHAVAQAIGRIQSIAAHLPLKVPPARVAVAYSAPSNDVFSYAGQQAGFIEGLRGIYRTLWERSIPQDVVTPGMEWSHYKAVYLPNFAALDDAAISRIREALQADDGPRLVADGYFGTFAGSGRWSFQPPEGLSDLVSARVADFNKIAARDIRRGANVLVSEFGEVPITTECPYAILRPEGEARAIATLNGEVVGVQTGGGRLTWWGLPLSTAFGGAAPPELVVPMLTSLGVESPFSIAGDHLVAFRRFSRLGGSLIFLLNLEPTLGRATVRPNWRVESLTDPIGNETVRLTEGAFDIEIPPGSVRILHAADVEEGEL